MVRRPDDCLPCRSGEPDMCLEGGYTERGIKGRHGFLSELYVEKPEYLIKIPAHLRDVGVLLEPLTVVEKGVRHAWSLQRRMRAWEPRKALILGAGPIGLLGALLMRLKGLETFVYGREPSATTEAKLREIGATYVSKQDPSGTVVHHLGALPEEHGPFDFILEATGAASVSMGAMRILGLNGVLCLASVTGGEAPMEICASCLNLELVLGNRVVFGTVNANRVDFETGAKDMAEAATRWPGWLDGLITRRVPMERFREAFERRPGDVKVVVDVQP
jgi:glucose 1-dehydrogenase